jgi:hypothetical protein
MQSLPQVTLVDIAGNPIAPAASWPEWVDANRWVTTEPADDGMAFPEHADSLADRRRWQRQSNLSEASFAATPE